jgi:hypothetical protein
MNTQNDQWKHDSVSVKEYVDKMIAKLREVNAHPAAVVCIDTCFRPFLQWMHSVHRLRVDPELARNVTIKLMSFMTLEIASRMNTRDEDGERIQTSEWLEEFMSDLGNTIAEDVMNVTHKANN